MTSNLNSNSMNCHSRFLALFLASFFFISDLQSQETNPPETLKQLLDQNGQLHTVILLDSVLCLNESQWKKAKSLVAEQWDSAWNSDMQAMTLKVFGTSRQEIINSIDFSELESKLSPSQLNAFNEISEISSIDFSDLLGETDSPAFEAKTANHKTKLTQLIDLKIEELLELSNANKNQTKMLRVARNGVVSRAEAQWRDVIKIYSEDSSSPEAERRAMSLIRRHILQQCTTDEVWQQGLSKVFDEKQLELIQSREHERTKATRTQFFNDFIIFWMHKRCGIKIGQHLQLISLMDKNIKTEFGLEMLEIEKQFAKIPEEDFRKILDDSQWRKLQPVLNHLRDN